MRNIIVVTGGAGFVGSNLIKFLIKKRILELLVLMTSSESMKNHIKNKKILYKKSHTKNISTVLNKYKKNKFNFSFRGVCKNLSEFLKMNDCIQSNTIGTNAVFDFCCLKNKIKLIYSATSASLGNRGKDKNLSPYAFTKSKNLEFLENLKKWFKFKYEVIFFLQCLWSKSNLQRKYGYCYWNI